MSFAAVYDACVLYPFEERDILMYSAYTRLFRVHWSDEILDECARNLVKDGRVTEDEMKRMIASMNENFPDANTSKSQYEHLIEAMTCDKKDRHVLAVAVARKADVIVTYNDRDFPKESLQPHSIETKTPDEFVLDVVDLDPDLFLIWYQKMIEGRIAAAKKHGRKPPTAQSIAEYLANGRMTKAGKAILKLLNGELFD